eukprot:3970956-Pleurochrysis_carterae.AAC.1
MGMPVDEDCHFDFLKSPFPTMIELLKSDKTGWFFSALNAAHFTATTNNYGAAEYEEEATNRMVRLLEPSIYKGAFHRNVDVSDILHHVRNIIHVHLLL